MPQEKQTMGAIFGFYKKIVGIFLSTTVVWIFFFFFPYWTNHAEFFSILVSIPAIVQQNLVATIKLLMSLNSP